MYRAGVIIKQNNNAFKAIKERHHRNGVGESDSTEVNDLLKL